MIEYAFSSQRVVETALAAGDFVPMPRAPPSEEPIRPPEREEVKMEGLRTAFAWIWSCMTSLFWVGMFFLDIAIVIGMQIFLESIGQKRTGREIMSKKAMANALAKQAAQRGVSTGQDGQEISSHILDGEVFTRTGLCWSEDV